MTKTTIIIKPGSKWRKRGEMQTYTVIAVGEDVVTAKVNTNCYGHRLSRRLFGRATGYLPVSITTKPTLRAPQ